jgi:hypothetical protein
MESVRRIGGIRSERFQHQKESPADYAGLFPSTISPVVKRLRANLTRQEIGKAWQDRGDKMGQKQKLAGVARTTQRE